MELVHAVYKDGIFKPSGPVSLPDDCEVEFVPNVVGKPDDPEHRKRVEEILSFRFNSGQGDLAERHNEHQP